MRQIRTSGLMSGEGKRNHWPRASTPPRPSSTLRMSNMRTIYVRLMADGKQWRVDFCGKRVNQFNSEAEADECAIATQKAIDGPSKIEKQPGGVCKDCGANTSSFVRGERSEYYMVYNVLWKKAGMEEGFLCIGCLEKRLGRQLGPKDFTDAPVNNLSRDQTGRLQSRLLGVAPRD